MPEPGSIPDGATFPDVARGGALLRNQVCLAGEGLMPPGRKDGSSPASPLVDVG